MINNNMDSMNKLQPYWNPEILENRVFMLIPVTFDAASKLDRTACRRLDKFIREKIKGISASKFSAAMSTRFPNMGVSKSAQLWADLSDDATEDFHPFIRQITSVPKEDQPNNLYFAHPLRLAQEDLVSQVKGGKPRHFKLKLRQAASKRCGRDFVFFQFFAPSIYGFASGTAILVLEWKYLCADNGQVSAAEVIEGNYAISHPNRGKQRPCAPVYLNDNSVIFEADDFLALAKAVLPPELSEKISAKRHVLYTTVRVAPSKSHDAEDKISHLAHRLACRQTLDYQPDPARVSVGQLRPFVNVRHAATIEGGCTLIEANDNAPEVLRMFIGDRVRNTYLPLLLVSFHAYFWLLKQTLALPVSSSARNLHREKQDLEHIQERVLNFRRMFHFPIASQLSQHNEFHAIWQRALMIDRQLDVLCELSVAAARLAQEKRVKMFGYMSGGVGGFLLFKEFADIIRDKVTTNTYKWQDMLLKMLIDPNIELQRRLSEAVRTAENWEWYVTYAAVAGLILGTFSAWYFGLKAGKE